MANSIETHFATQPDLRSDRGNRHKLSDMIVIAVTAVICCADSWSDVADFGLAKRKWFEILKTACDRYSMPMQQKMLRQPQQAQHDDCPPDDMLSDGDTELAPADRAGRRFAGDHVVTARTT